MLKRIFYVPFLLVLALMVAACSSDGDNNNNNNNTEQNEDVNQNEQNGNENDKEDQNETNVNEENNANNDEQNDEKQASNDEEQNTVDEQTSDFETIEFEEITLSIPTNAIKHDLGDMEFPNIAYILDMTSEANFNVLVEDLPEELELTLDDYIEIAIENSGIDYDSNTSMEINGMEWAELTGETDGIPLIQRTFMHDHAVYIFSFGAAPDSFEEWLPVFEKIIDSVEIVE